MRSSTLITHPTSFVGCYVYEIVYLCMCTCNIAALSRSDKKMSKSLREHFCLAISHQEMEVCGAITISLHFLSTILGVWGKTGPFRFRFYRCIYTLEESVA